MTGGVMVGQTIASGGALSNTPVTYTSYTSVSLVQIERKVNMKKGRLTNLKPSHWIRFITTWFHFFLNEKVLKTSGDFRPTWPAPVPVLGLPVSGILSYELTGGSG